MARKVKVAEVHEIEDGDGKCVYVGIDRVAVFRVGQQFFGISDACPHAGGPLSEGWVDDDEVTCPWHGWSFPLVHGDGSDGLSRYPILVEDDGVYIELPE